MSRRSACTVIIASLLFALPTAADVTGPRVIRPWMDLAAAEGASGLDEATPYIPRLWVLVADSRANGTRPGCPPDMVDMESYCIERTPSRDPANWYAAADVCQARGRRLCSNEEWLQACDAAPLNGAQAMPEGGPEWLSSWVFDTSDRAFDAVEHGYFRCRTSSQPRPSSRPFELRLYRCCL